MRTVKTSASARAGLLGNPSDLYGGRGIGFTVAGWQVELEVQAGPDPGRAARPGSELLRAAALVFGRHRAWTPEEHAAEAALAVYFTSNIPRQVGLAGSSAIVMAYLRALAAWFAQELDVLDLARLTLAAEVEVLGIRAGPMDRLVQAHGGLLAMDFARPFAQGSVQRLPSPLAPPMLIAWDEVPKKSSGVVHAPVWDRWRAGDAEVHAVLAEYRPLVARGLQALVRGDRRELMACVDRNFDLRARIFAISERDRALIDLGRAHGAATKFCGSGGAILAVAAAPEELPALGRAYTAAGFPNRVVTVADS